MSRRLPARALLPRSGARLAGKDGGEQDLRSVRPQSPGRGKAECARLGTGRVVTSHPLLLLASSLVQVRSSLGASILSAMAAFAGTAILLMDFGVTNWVCLKTAPSSAGTWGTVEPCQGVGKVGICGTRKALGTGRACQSQHTP